jgi:UDP-2,3-diacylglucosamine pyrophosphatase LpxH
MGWKEGQPAEVTLSAGVPAFRGPSSMMETAATASRVRSGEVGYLVFSDVHLGSDINEIAPRPRRRPDYLDDELVALLDHYRVSRSKSASGLWHLVIAGDFIDFVGMLIEARASHGELLGADDSGDAGLGSPAAVALEKLTRAVERHTIVFRALGRFVDAGHELTFVIGNHDVELHWPVVQRALREAIADGFVAAARERILARIHVEPIFFWAPGALFVEHGHRYDPSCVNAAALAPHHPKARHRMLPTLSDVLLRLIVRRVEHVDEHGHDGNLGFGHYLDLVARTGTRGIGRLARAFFHAIGVALRTWWHLVRGGLRALKRLHRRRLRRFAAYRRIGWRRMRAFDAMAVKPSIASLPAILSTLLLDRVALFGVTPFFVLGALLLPASLIARAAAGLAFLLIARFVHEQLVARRELDAGRRMERRAADVARLFPAPFVVMGHTHVPKRIPLAHGAVYINTGTWAEEADPHGLVTPPAPRTHLVVEGAEAASHDAEVHAELRAWDPKTGAPGLFA